jgi:Flp pilus assembly pilin Flp
MSWVSIAGPLLASLVLLVLPGALIAYLLRLRGLWLIGIAAPVSVSLIAVASVISGWVGIPWGPLPVVGLSLLGALAAFLWTRFVGSRSAPERRAARRLSTILAVVVPAIVIGFVLIRSMVSPEYFAQRYDNFFHLNAIQYVLDTANASPLWVGTMTSPEGLPFYPSAWHATVSLVTLVSGAPVVVANNAVILAVAAVVWPLGAILLTRTLVGGNSVALVSAGVLSAASPAFPYLPLHYGVLYPLFLGLACLPAAIAVAYRALRPGAVDRRYDWIVLVVLVVPGVAIAHPGALIGLLALTVPLAVGAFAVRVARENSVPKRIAWIAGLSGYLIAGLGILQLVRPPADQIYWPVIGSLPHAIGDVVSAAVYQYPLAQVFAASLVIGAYSVVRRPSYGRWVLLGIAAVGSVLYIIVAGSTIETLRTWLTAPWYNNTPRLASLWVVSVIPLAALGAAAFIRWLLRTVTSLRRVIDAQPVAGLLVFAVALTALTQGSAIRQAAADIEYTYEIRPDAPIVSPDELTLLKRLDEIVPDSAVIAGDPWTGASFAYGLSGRTVLMPHLLMDESDAARVINTRLDSEGDSPAVCDALRETGVTYVLDFHEGGDFMENDGDFSGLDRLAASPYVEVVAEEGNARLFRIVSCGLAS